MVFHQPVLLNEAIKLLNIKKERKYIDATVGGGGHAEAVLKAGGRVLGIDWDPEAVRYAKEYLKKACPDTSWKITRGNFANLEEIANKEGFGKVSGILFDLGVSSYQLKTSERGFSFQKDASLDMRMDPRLAITAADLLKVLSKKQLNVLFTRFAQEKRARAIADAIVRARRIKPIETTKELADLVTSVYGGKRKIRAIHPATKVFLALRIVVNSELENLKIVLSQVLDLLKPNGRLVVISFHESEDRIVKRFLKNEKKIQILTKKPITPSEEEIRINPRSRSAKLRAGEKI
ncbi:16S rRNA (cytosine(1402)-N(4))-methyltransferase RsmH [Candidatus Microgenomates bacterium]|nr:16S rRNA (cytosine(1402)-N(4))-methyltransferase RsmH [Candidatus Microgenomates bacterium]